MLYLVIVLAQHENEQRCTEILSIGHGPCRPPPTSKTIKSVREKNGEPITADLKFLNYDYYY